MFTGLIEEVGHVVRWRSHGKSAVLTVRTGLPLREVKIGSSIAVNGACLTVVRKGRGTFTVDVSPETLERTSLEKIRQGGPVNLERPLRFSDRLGGHLVTGHVDGVGIVHKIEESGDFTFFTFRVPARIGALLVPKGSVAIDGISLTVNECAARLFSVAIIPFTLKHTNLRACRVGGRVNIEGDLIGKYVQKFLKTRQF